MLFDLEQPAFNWIQLNADKLLDLKGFSAWPRVQLNATCAKEFLVLTISRPSLPGRSERLYPICNHPTKAPLFAAVGDGAMKMGTRNKYVSPNPPGLAGVLAANVNKRSGLRNARRCRREGCRWQCRTLLVGAAHAGPRLVAVESRPRGNRYLRCCRRRHHSPCAPPVR